MSQLYVAFFFYRSAYKKIFQFDRVKAEFARWGYHRPGLVTRFLSGVWIVGGSALLIPTTVGLAAAVLMVFMIFAIATLVYHGELNRLIEPAGPTALILLILVIRGKETLTQLSVWFS